MGEGEEIIIQLVIGLIFGTITSSIAVSKGRNGVGWFFVGFFIGCIGLIIILCLSNLKEEQARLAAQEVEQRRLREQLRQEQLKNEALRQHTVARLDQHDQALGVDTREAAPALNLPPAKPAPAMLVTGEVADPPEGYPADNWFISEGGTQEGPFTWDVLRRRASQGTLAGDTLVWAKGMAEWEPAGKIPTLIQE